MALIPDTITFKTRYVELRAPGFEEDLPYSNIVRLSHVPGFSFCYVTLADSSRLVIKPDNYKTGIEDFLTDLRKKLK